MELERAAYKKLSRDEQASIRRMAKKLKSELGIGYDMALQILAAVGRIMVEERK